MIGPVDKKGMVCTLACGSIVGTKLTYMGSPQNEGKYSNMFSSNDGHRHLVTVLILEKKEHTAFDGVPLKRQREREDEER